ncbi:MAG: S8 family serine peptidase [Bacteroidales bacterium]|nr:S8 family serine peptidase [Bacteroidales bacterium]
MKKTTFTMRLVFALFALFPLSGIGQKQTNYQLNFKNQQFTPSENIDEFINAFSPTAENTFDGKFYKIIQFNEIPAHVERNLLRNSGIDLLDYIPHFGYFASFTLDYNPNALIASDTRSIVDITSVIKLAPMLFEESYPDYALRGDGRIGLLLTAFDGVNSENAIAALQAKGFEVSGVQADGNFYFVTAKLDDIELLTAFAFVNYVEPVYPDPEPENYTGRTLHRSNAIAGDLSTGRHYDGTGVSVMLQDDGQIGPHIDFEGRIIEQFLGYLGGDHGDHCAGIIAGAGNLDPFARGNAYGANLYTYEAAPDYPGFNSIPSHYFSKNIRVSSTSYSNGCNAGYTTLARSLDIQIINYPALMHVFSAGNDGTSNCGYGAGAGWGNITGGHKVGKNVLTVANLDYIDNLSGSSSRGPAHDGRIKPDISAKGSSVYSTLPDNGYGLKSGTSMSCPGVAGVMAQLFHAYRELNSGSDPRGGLLKGIVLNTADDLGNFGPDFKFGWGRINALRAVRVLEEGRYDSASIENGQTLNHEFVVPENTGQMKVMVYWTDIQGSVNTNLALVNNLDIRVTDPSTGEWLPWVLNHYPDADSLDKPAIRGLDDRNNMEQVTLENPDAGTYTLSVDGNSVPQGPQKYYIIYEFVPKDIVITYPFGGESFSPGQQEVIRWDAYSDDEIFTIEYSLDNGQTWNLISDNVNGERRYFEWNVPTGMTSQAKVRVLGATSSGVSQEAFSIMPVPYNFEIDWACDNAIHLSWTDLFGASSYTIYKLGEKFMEPVASTTIKSIIIEDISAAETYWFAISATGPDGAESMRTTAIKKNPGLFNCNEVDAMMVSAPSVNWGVFQSYMSIDALTVTVEVKNFGIEPISNPTLSFQLDEGNIVSELFSGVIDPDSTLLFSFGENIGISEIGMHNLKTWIDYPLDQNPDNDMINTAIELIEGSVMTPGNTQTLENFTNCIPAPICSLNNCDLAEGWINLTNLENDDIDWITWHGATNTYNTGPTADHTTGNSDGKYLYIEPSVICFDKMAILTAPSIDLTGGMSPALDFWYHAYGADIGRLHIDVFNGSEIIFDIVEPIVGDQGNEWKNMTVDLSEFNGKIIGLRFRAYTGGKDKGDLALDDISITDVTSGRNFAASPAKLNVYPNPANGFVNISVGNAGTESCDLNIFDIYGRRVYGTSLTPLGGNIVKAVDLSALPEGVYYVRLKSEEGISNTKITLQ